MSEKKKTNTPTGEAKPLAGMALDMAALKKAGVSTAKAWPETVLIDGVSVQAPSRADLEATAAISSACFSGYRKNLAKLVRDNRAKIYGV